MDARPDPGLFEIIASTRAMRRLAPDPVPDELVQKVLEAAVCAPSGGNRQPWGFVVVKDPEIKRRVQVYYQRAFDELVEPLYQTGDPPPGVSRAEYDRQFAAVRYLTEHYHEAPVWIVACLGDEGGSSSSSGNPTRSSGSSIYPAVQNMLLAARALGLGATLTSRHVRFGREVDQILGLPDGVFSYAILPIGYPLGRFGPVRRRPLREVVHLDQWGQPYPALSTTSKQGE